MKRFLVRAVGALLCCGAANAQLALPGAAPAPSSDAPATAASPKKAHKSAPLARAPGPDAAAGRDLLLNGADGLLRISALDKDKGLRVEKFTLMGEVVSDPSQKCQIDIVADAPIEAKSLGTPDGLARYSVDIPACPLTFDVLDGALLAPAQTTACVFQSADCQANPGGLWGPAGASLEKDAKAIAKERARADASISDSLRRLQAHDKQSSGAALSREQNDFAAQRAELCRSYAGEAQHGYCAARVTEARAALLHSRAEPSKGAASDANN
jgi:hypothetical protein